jgi:paraquat-inducible protein B
VTSNVRFWKDSGVAFDMSAQGMRVEMVSLATLFSGGVSFDVPDGWDRGEQVKEKTEYQLSITNAASRIRCTPYTKIT